MSRGRRIVAVAVAAGLLLLTGVGGSSPAAGAAPATCEPGSGAQLAGKRIDAAALAEIETLACADLTGANLAGADLIQEDLTGVNATRATFTNARLGQADLPGAILTGADLTGADLSQATLTGADLSAVLATGADFGQAHAENARFTGATLTDASFIQATVTGAVFDGASVSGADFTQADTAGASFLDVQGLVPWNTYLLYAAIVAFLLVLGVAARRAWRRRRRPVEVIGTVDATQPAMAGLPTPHTAAGYPGFGAVGTPVGGFQPINGRSRRSAGRALALGLVAAALIAFGFHLFLGGLIGTFSFAFDTLATTACTGATCAVGVDSGMIGLWAGIFAVIAGFFVLARA